MASAWDFAIQLSGRYSRTIQIYLLCDLALSIGWILVMAINHDWHEWYLFLPVPILTIPMLTLYSKTIAVKVYSKRLYIRDSKIDVTNKIKNITRQTDCSVIIRFNFLYQLNVKGSPEQIGYLMEQLKSYEAL